jgi:hypothetical protein
MLPLAEAAARAGRSYAVASQCVSLRNIPFVKEGGRVFVPVSYVETWRTRNPHAGRRPDLTARMVEIAEEIKSLNSGKRGQVFVTPQRYAS